MIDQKISYSSPTKLYTDKKSAINVAHNPIHHDRTKHVEIGRHFIKKKIEERIIILSHVLTKFQEADTYQSHA